MIPLLFSACLLSCLLVVVQEVDHRNGQKRESCHWCYYSDSDSDSSGNAFNLQCISALYHHHQVCVFTGPAKAGKLRASKSSVKFGGGGKSNGKTETDIETETETETFSRLLPNFLVIACFLACYSEAAQTSNPDSDSNSNLDSNLNSNSN